MFSFAVLLSFMLLFLSVPIFLVFGLGSSVAAIWGLDLPLPSIYHDNIKVIETISKERRV